METLYKRLFAGIYDPFTNSLEKEIYKYRKEILADVKGKVLEVGAGTGINFQFYNDKVKLIALEPSPFMTKRAELKIPAGLKVQFLTNRVNDKEVEELIKDKSLDFIVSTLVLCSIDDPRESLHKFYRWLKDDGKLIVLEHIHSENAVNKKIQNVVNPVWKKLADGCNLNRNTDLLIKENGFEVEKERYFNSTLRFHSGIYRKSIKK